MIKIQQLSVSGLEVAIIILVIVLLGMLIYRFIKKKKGRRDE